MESELEVTDVVDILFGRWKSQILYAGVKLGVFEHLSNKDWLDANTIATKIGADPVLLYRLMRALSSIGLLNEDGQKRFSIAEAAVVLTENHPQSLRFTALLESIAISTVFEKCDSCGPGTSHSQISNLEQLRTLEGVPLSILECSLTKPAV